MRGYEVLLTLSPLACFFAAAQDAGLTLLPDVVPVGVPEGDYTGAYRPRVHFSPPAGFMNDPNGMFVDAKGIYHLYYQYNPTDVVAGNQHWGHATSQDLYTWTNQPIALAPSGAEGEGIFSGSAVVDVNNTSGFFPNQTDGVVAIYTLHTPEEQTQDIAYSRDGGYTFTKYSDNPVISIGSRQFRDPKVIWHEPTARWVMVVAYAQEYAIGFFTSSDLKAWDHASNFSHSGLLGLQYECPSLVQVPTLKNASADQLLDSSNYADVESWILFLSINPGAPLGGSVSQYFPGSFNGTHFEPYDSAARLSDFGKDNYAGQFFYGVPSGPQVSIAWASNWQYTNVVPTDKEGFRSIMSVPRVGVLANTTRNPFALMSIPYDLTPIYTSPEPLAASQNLANSSLFFDFGEAVESRAISFTVNATGVPRQSASGYLNFTLLSKSTGESIRGGFILSGDPVFWLDRGSTRGFDNEFFNNRFSAGHLVDPSTQKLSMSVIVDRSIIEVFLDNGVKSGTSVFFTEEPLDILLLAVGELSEGSEAAAEVWGLKDTWALGQEESRPTNSTQVLQRP